jgi:predicted amidophosphoribosyltransferase
MRKHAVSQVIQRATSTKQRQASKAQRIAQAKVAFKIAGTVNPDIPYLLIDDVMTTGATIQSAAQLLKDSGARDIWVAIIARQPLD